MERLIERIHAVLDAGMRNVKYGVYDDNDTLPCIGLMNVREAAKTFLGGKQYYIDKVTVEAYSASYSEGATVADGAMDDLLAAGFVMVESVEPRYDKDINKYAIKFVISEL